ncbi:MAG: hypothetical protein CK538_01730 [Opitutia bacterium]|nr:hypothetical protein [Opitutaceae bacterium]PHX86798.1 MAG: hypothetical protein CK538_01730 [Opitutae bacterium]
MNKNLEIIREKNNAAPSLRRELEAEHEQLRQAFAALGAGAEPPKSREQNVRIPTPGGSTRQAVADAARVTPIGDEPLEQEPPALLSFDNWKVNTAVPPLLLGFAWLVSQSPFAFFLQGFHVWIHELGHAVPAWLRGKKALPLPIGFTLIEPDYALSVHWGLLVLFGILLVAGIKLPFIFPRRVYLHVDMAALDRRLPGHRRNPVRLDDRRRRRSQRRHDPTLERIRLG